MFLHNAETVCELIVYLLSSKAARMKLDIRLSEIVSHKLIAIRFGIRRVRSLGFLAQNSEGVESASNYNYSFTGNVV